MKQLLCVFLESRCEFCRRTTTDTLCEYCFARLASHQLSKSDRLNLYQLKSVYAWGRYDGQLKRAIAQMKYQNQPEIGNLLGTELGLAWIDSKLTELSSKITVVPIPMHPKKQKERGFNQAEVIARSFCRLTGYQKSDRALMRVRETEAMFNLSSKKERAKNLQGALRVGKIPKQPVLLIDDIYTTGTTVNEAIKVLQQKKIKVVGVAVAAKAGSSIE